MGTAMAAFVPADRPPLTSFFDKAAPSFAAAEDDVVPVVVVPEPVPDVDAAALVPEEATVAAAVADVAVIEAPDDASVDDDFPDLGFAEADVANVVEILLLLISDCREARMEDWLAGFGGVVGNEILLSLMAVNAGAMVEVTMPVCKVKGSEEEGEGNWRGSRRAMVNMCSGGVSKDSPASVAKQRREIGAR